ncbi:MAG TPA: glycosyltransferase family 1 protein [Chloroflexia bacterium]|nr:glycosyltransferase family 1 protein [Chloroflexia bacterium]
MRIAINANLVSFSGTYRQAGVSKYTELLINHLGKVDSENEYLIYFGNGPHPAHFASAPNFHLRASRFNTEKPLTRIAWEQAVAPGVLLWDHPDVLHCPVNVVPLASFSPAVLTIHDLGFMRFPERYKAAKRRYLHVMTSLSARKASHIITPSESVRQEVIDLLKIRPDKVTAVAEGAGQSFRVYPEQEVAEWRKANNVPDRFVLYLGTLEPRKNLPLLLRAFARWRQEQPSQARDVVLVLGGAKGWLYEEIFRLVKELDLESVTRFQGYISENDLPLWYNSARCFVYPSVYEGFGLPPLEAMASGCPVITSNTSSLPEVVGEAGIMVGPDDVDALTAGLASLLTDEAEYSRRRKACLERAAGFTWTQAARQTLDIYRQVASKK